MFINYEAEIAVTIDFRPPLILRRVISIVISLEVMRGRTWGDDNWSQGSTESCPSGNFAKQPSFLSAEKGCPGQGGAYSYIDAPGASGIFASKVDFKFKVTAWCRCKCEDDKKLDQKEFNWNSHDGIK
jgi:hypothetical protein